MSLTWKQAEFIGTYFSGNWYSDESGVYIDFFDVHICK